MLRNCMSEVIEISDIKDSTNIRIQREDRSALLVGKWQEILKTHPRIHEYVKFAKTMRKTSEIKPISFAGIG